MKITTFYFWVLLVMSGVSYGDTNAPKPLWKLAFNVQPSAVIRGVISEEGRSSLIIKVESDGTEVIAQRFLGVNVKFVGGVVYSNAAFKLSTPQKDSPAGTRFDKHQKVYVTAGTHPDANILSVNLKKIYGKESLLVVSRLMVGTLDILVLERAIDEEALEELKGESNRDAR